MSRQFDYDVGVNYQRVARTHLGHLAPMLWKRTRNKKMSHIPCFRLSLDRIYVRPLCRSIPELYVRPIVEYLKHKLSLCEFPSN